ncbi:MAG: Rdx family protein [Immundisolibacterales bacterium]|nr:Rdx family protein [Immundisolibacterales bacterium]
MSARDDMIMEFGADVELVKSGGGVFEVTVDDELVFSKKALGRFPEQGELRGLATGSPAP